MQCTACLAFGSRQVKLLLLGVLLVLMLSLVVFIACETPAAFRMYLAMLLGPAWLDPQVAVTHHEGLLLSNTQHMLHMLRVGKLHKAKVGTVIASDLSRQHLTQFAEILGQLHVCHMVWQAAHKDSPASSLKLAMPDYE